MANIMNAFYTVLGWPLGWVMWLFYRLTGVYGIALLVFTIFTRLIMIPMTINQQKSMAKMAIIRPQMEDLQRKYKNNREKLGEELNKLYAREGYSATSGCLPMLIQFPILFGLIDVIYKPLTHILRVSGDIIQIGSEIAAAAAGGLPAATSLLNPSQWSAIRSIAVAANAGGATATVRNGGGLSTIQLEIIRGVKEMPALYRALGSDTIAVIEGFQLNFLGLDLTRTPKFGWEILSNFDPLIFIPILAGLSALAMSVISMRNSSTADANTAGMMKGMMLSMPIISMMIAFSVPAGVGLYWFYSNVVGAAQSAIMNKIYNPKEMAEKAKQEYEERRERERLERIEAKKLAKQGDLENKEKAMSQKEINRRRLAEARRRDAEKYGEAYDAEAPIDDLR